MASERAIVNLSAEDLLADSPEKPLPDGLYSAGLHPWWTTRPDAELLWTRIQRRANETAVVAIGECGIDRLQGADIESQIQWFRRHITLSETTRKPLIIHCVRAYDLLLHEAKTVPHTQAWILHGYNRGPALARQLLEAGFYLSFGRRHNAAALALTPPQRRFWESDTEPTPPQPQWYDTK